MFNRVISNLKSHFTLIVFAFLIQVLFSCASCTNNEDSLKEGEEPDLQTQDLNLTTEIPIGPNSWVMNDLSQDQAIISEKGIFNWSSTDDVIRTYISTDAGKLQIGLKMKSSDGKSKIKVTIGDDSQVTTVASTTFQLEQIGEFDVEPGYKFIEIRGLEKSGDIIADINELWLGGTAIANGVTYNPTSNFYFGRRGPSVHLSYEVAAGQNVQWFYNEVTVPEGEDQLGSFFMANGHSQGYFGMQVNSETERRVLFSIWSAFNTDDPNQIPDDYKVTNLGNGPGVTVKDFGNEGSGIQSFIDLDWKAGVTYKFLLKGEPAPIAGSTDYTGYFFDPEKGSWKLIAKLRRPKTSTYLTGVHSFLENFIPSTGNHARKGEYGNQWVYTTEGTWVELTNAKFTFDATASAGDRLDYAGGTTGSTFYLKNCGFFSENTSYGVTFSRTPSGTAPEIDFSSLPEPEAPVEVTPVDRSNWSVIDYSSQEDQGGEGETGLATDVLDNDLQTYWHSCWSNCTPAPPHHITIDMGDLTTIDGLRFNQRQSLSRSVKEIRIEVSNDNSTWTSLGTFELQNTAGTQDITFSNSQQCRYMKFIATSAFDGADHAAMAEITAFSI